MVLVKLVMIGSALASMGCGYKMFENSKIQDELSIEGKSGSYVLKNYGSFSNIAEITQIRHEQRYNGFTSPGKNGYNYQYGSMHEIKIDEGTTRYHLSSSVDQNTVLSGGPKSSQSHSHSSLTKALEDLGLRGVTINYESPNISYDLKIFEYTPTDPAIYMGDKLIGLGKDPLTLVGDVFPRVGWALGGILMGAITIGTGCLFGLNNK